MYIDKLAAIISEYNNTYYRAIKMKPDDVKSSIYIDFDNENNKEDPKFEVGGHVRISKYNIFFQNIVLQIGPRKLLLLK